MSRLWRGAASPLVSGMQWVAPFVAVGGLVLLVGYAVATHTKLIGVRHVQVSGLERLTSDDVLQAAGISVGQPMVSLDTPKAEGSVGRLAGVEDVEITRAWPTTVRILVSERHPVLVAPASDGGFALVDRFGVPYVVVDDAPADLPVVSLPRSESDPGPALRQAAEAVAALAEVMQRSVRSVDASEPESLKMRLTDDRGVFWGGPERSADKARALSLLMGGGNGSTIPNRASAERGAVAAERQGSQAPVMGTMFDVSTPGLVLVR